MTSFATLPACSPRAPRPWLTPLLVLLAALMLGVAAMAQTVRAENASAYPFEGWVRCTTDRMPPHRSGIAVDANGDTVRYVLGRPTGLDTRVLDVWARLEPGARLSIDLARSRQAPWTLTSSTDDVAPPTIAGVPMQLVREAPDGAAWSSHYRARVGRTLVADLWTTQFAEHPGWATAELVVTSSHPGVDDRHETIPGEFTLRWNGAFVAGMGLEVGASLVPAGTRLADGQARGVPVVLMWPRKLATASDWSTMLAVAGREYRDGRWLYNPGVCSVAIEQLLPCGNPRLPQGFDADAWTRNAFPESVRRLHTWEPGIVGPSPRSADSGEQNTEQVFVRGEFTQSVAASRVAWLSGLKMLGRPCHFAELDGGPVLWSEHPNCVPWSGRPPRDDNVSPDKLGSTLLTEGDTTFQTPAGPVTWYGPDDEHWMLNTTAAGARLTGSHALQFELSAQANLWLMHETLPSQGRPFPPWMNSGPRSARSVGYAGMLATRLFQTLEDRALAEAVRTRWHARVREVYLPSLSGVWDKRHDQRLEPDSWWAAPDPKPALKERWMPWQVALGAYGLDEACEVLGPVDGRALALAAAKVVLDRAYVLFGKRWTTLTYPTVEGDPDTGTGFFDQFGVPLAAAVVLRHEPGNAKALSIWNQTIGDARSGKDWGWVYPGTFGGLTGVHEVPVGEVR